VELKGKGLKEEEQKGYQVKRSRRESNGVDAK